MKTAEERFWEKVDIRSEDECWLWKGGRSGKCRPGGVRYGVFKIDGKVCQSHRAIWMIINGSIPEGMYICHHCDNPLCVNPKHLFLGTPYDNNHDMIDKGRYVCLSGEDAPGTKLTKEEVEEIKRMYIPRKVTQSYLAKLFGVTQANIYAIVNGISWAR